MPQSKAAPTSKARLNKTARWLASEAGWAVNRISPTRSTPPSNPIRAAEERPDLVALFWVLPTQNRSTIQPTRATPGSIPVAPLRGRLKTSCQGQRRIPRSTRLAIASKIRGMRNVGGVPEAMSCSSYLFEPLRFGQK